MKENERETIEDCFWQWEQARGIGGSDVAIVHNVSLLTQKDFTLNMPDAPASCSFPEALSVLTLSALVSAYGGISHPMST